MSVFHTTCLKAQAHLKVGQSDMMSKDKLFTRACVPCVSKLQHKLGRLGLTECAEPHCWLHMMPEGSGRVVEDLCPQATKLHHQGAVGRPDLKPHGWQAGRAQPAQQGNTLPDRVLDAGQGSELDDNVPA